MPAILDAKLPRDGVPATSQGHPKNIFTLFGGQGYKVVASEEATSMCPTRYCPGDHGGVGRIKELMRAGRRARYANWLNWIRPGPPTLYYKHLFLPHGPRAFLPSGKEVPKPPDSLVGLSTTRGYDDQGLTDHNHLRYLQQLAFTDRKVGELLATLRRQGIYDEALIVLTADHGYAFDIRTKDRRLLTSRNVDEIAPVPLFIKAPRQRRAVVDNAYLRTVDILPTVAAGIGLKLDWAHSGRPVSDPSVRKRQGLSLVTRDSGGAIDRRP